jgi:hypothetical protein
MFESTQTLLQEYTNWAFQTDNAFSQDHANELRERIQQLDFLAIRIAECEKKQARLGFEEPSGQLSNFLEMRLYVEAFYYFAFRIRNILRRDLLPGLKFFECVGVRDVRNHLIEHPEGKSAGDIQQSFGFDPERGMTLKGSMAFAQPDTFRDPGFRANSCEFKAALNRVLRTAVARGHNSL